MFANSVKIRSNTLAAVQKTFAEHAKKYEEEETKIKAGAVFWGITLETGVRYQRVFTEFYSAFPKWFGRIVMNRLKRNEGNPQIAHVGLTRCYLWQSLFATMQTVSFLLFLIFGLAYAALA